ncbi:MAG: hypothetical protein CMO01_22270 [Thalassobius sp.]|nr:hypothetical protein [Thalassovita sp.]
MNPKNLDLSPKSLKVDLEKAIPPAARNVKGWRYFAGLFGGEHIAATEFVIGVTFVVMGVGTTEVLLGLLLGNILAVLSWALVTAPIAVDTRLSLYAYLQKIGGPVVTKIFNLVNVFYYGALAAAMITVSSFAIRFALDIPVQLNWYPTSIPFVLVVLLVGAVVVAVASFGFETLANFATICAPWMLVCFICGAALAIPALSIATYDSMDFGGLDGFINMAEKYVWIGKTPTGETGISIWEVAGFAWANLAMVHLGLIDMAIFRFAKKKTFGFFSAIGMFLGHYLAWIAAGLMGAGAAVIIGGDITKLDSGDVAYYTLGFTGIMVVVTAGWTTANACLYRAGLAAGNVFLSVPRKLVTLGVGVLVVIAAAFPFIVSSVLPLTVFGAIALVPIGGIVLAEHWLFPKLNLTRYWAAYKKVVVSWPAILAWGFSIAFAIVLNTFDIISFYFIFLPEYLISIVIYTVLASMMGAKTDYPKLSAQQELREEVLEEYEQKRDAFQEEVEEQTESSGKGKLLLGFASFMLIAMLGFAFWIAISSNSPAYYREYKGIFQNTSLVFTGLYFASALLAMRSYDN